MNPVILKADLTLELAVGKFPAVLVGANYLNNPKALALYFVSDDGLGEPLAKASIYLEKISDCLPPDEFICKTYSENVGMDEWLLAAGIASETGDGVFIARAHCPILKLAPELFTILSEGRNVQAH